MDVHKSSPEIQVQSLWSNELSLILQELVLDSIQQRETPVLHHVMPQLPLLGGLWPMECPVSDNDQKGKSASSKLLARKCVRPR